MDKKRDPGSGISPACREYISRINAVQDYVERNIDKPFTLDELAEVSGFSKFHFHRIFSGIVNETVYNYIARLRLERAASFLLHSPELSVTGIALDSGFSDSAVFARAFKKRYGMSASRYRAKFSKDGKALNISPMYNRAIDYDEGRQNAMKKEIKVDIKDVPEMTVIYLRHVGSYGELGKVFKPMIGRLFQWGFEHGVMKQDETRLLAIYHDNPEITEDDKKRTSICITVPNGTRGEGEFGEMTLPAGKYAIGHFEIDDENSAAGYGESWNYLFGQWLPESGYQPDDKPSFEMYLNNPDTHPERKHLIDIYLPVK